MIRLLRVAALFSVVSINAVILNVLGIAATAPVAWIVISDLLLDVIVVVILLRNINSISIYREPQNKSVPAFLQLTQHA